MHCGWVGWSLRQFDVNAIDMDKHVGTGEWHQI